MRSAYVVRTVEVCVLMIGRKGERGYGNGFV